MKRCPHCHEPYSDESLSFCRNDGTQLVPDDNDSIPTRRFPAGGDTAPLEDKSRPDDNVFTEKSRAKWLDGNGELRVCLAQPTPVSEEVILRDATRPDSVALAKAIFEKEGGVAPLARWFNQSPGVLLFPEYAFGSSAFSELNELIRNFPHRLIVCAGFGIVAGHSLWDLLKVCQPTWENGSGAIDPAANYNAGWCWVHEGPNTTRCFIFLKNFLEQRVELALTKLITSGKSIFRLVAQDLIFYPLICADLISNQADGPRARITRSLAADNPRPDRNKRVLVAGLLYTQQPYHSLWPPAINKVVELHENSGGLITVNQPYTNLLCDVKEDQWRCLSGGFISRNIMKRGPSPLLQSVRYVQTDSASGLILRTSGAGVACGTFRWVDSANEGRNVWVPDVRRFLVGGRLGQNGESAVLHEFRRYVQRHKSEIVKLVHASARPMVESSLDGLANETEENRVHPRLWSRLVTGVEEPPVSMNFDSMDAESETLDYALAGFACIEKATGGQPLTEKKVSGQLLWKEREILVWNSPTCDTEKMVHLLKTSHVQRQGQRMLIVLGKGRGGYRRAQKVVQKVSPDRFTDISTNRESRSFAQERVRHVFWCPLQKLENVLAKSTSAETKKKAIRRMLEPKPQAHN